MSVINQMLNDLEARRHREGEGARYMPAARTPLWLLALVTLTCLAGLLLVGWRGWLYWQAEAARHQALPEVDSVVVHPATGEPAERAQIATVSPPHPDGTGMDTPRPPLTPTQVAEPDTEVALPVPDRALSHEEELVVPPGEDPEAFYARVDAALQPERQEEEALQAGAADPAPKAPPKNQLRIDRVSLSPAELAALADKKASSALARGDMAEAERQYVDLLELQPQQVAPRKQLAALLYGQGRLEEANRLLEEGVRRHPTEPDFRLLLARLALATGQQSQALNWLAGARPPLPGNLDYYATWAGVAQELGHTGEARDLYLQLLRSKPDEGRWWLGLGVAEERLGNGARALDAYRSAQLHGGLGDASSQWLGQRIAALTP
ncbi:tetratricopeptide repeat protein [Aeromonas schubertii]|uniref:tetratricopeptide repeat protein n=1 Tax=Aeromonas schubertii TaxID=652 RepID=UPI001CC3A210|nr:tetratricopeptide repeat protein [Aeromonas schubertii]MBZ6074112.1 tetratricopeptide repeat protein [Aeromonas schubertii]